MRSRVKLETPALKRKEWRPRPFGKNDPGWLVKANSKAEAGVFEWLRN